MTKTILIIALSAAALAACTSLPPRTLAQQQASPNCNFEFSFDSPNPHVLAYGPDCQISRGPN